MIGANSARYEYERIFNEWKAEFEKKYQKTIDKIEVLIHEANKKNAEAQCTFVYDDCDVTYFPDVFDLLRYLKGLGYLVHRKTDDEKYHDEEELVISWEKEVETFQELTI